MNVYTNDVLAKKDKNIDIKPQQIIFYMSLTIF